MSYLRAACSWLNFVYSVNDFIEISYPKTCSSSTIVVFQQKLVELKKLFSLILQFVKHEYEIQNGQAIDNFVAARHVLTPINVRPLGRLKMKKSREVIRSSALLAYLVLN